MTNEVRKRNYLALLIGLILVVCAGFAFSSRLDFVQSSVRTEGRVIRLNHGAHHPEVAFVTRTGERTSFPASFITADVGDMVQVRYNPAMPRETAEIDSFTNIWFEPILLGVFAAAFLFAGWTGQEFRGRYG